MNSIEPYRHVEIQHVQKCDFCQRREVRIEKTKKRVKAIVFGAGKPLVLYGGWWYIWTSKMVALADGAQTESMVGLVLLGLGISWVAGIAIVTKALMGCCAAVDDND